jgi:hypothetical protein
VPNKSHRSDYRFIESIDEISNRYGAYVTPYNKERRHTGELLYNLPMSNLTRPKHMLHHWDKRASMSCNNSKLEYLATRDEQRPRYTCTGMLPSSFIPLTYLQRRVDATPKRPFLPNLIMWPSLDNFSMHTSSF